MERFPETQIPTQQMDRDVRMSLVYVFESHALRLRSRIKDMEEKLRLKPEQVEPHKNMLETLERAIARCK